MHCKTPSRERDSGRYRSMRGQNAWMSGCSKRISVCLGVSELSVCYSETNRGIAVTTNAQAHLELVDSF
jgi:hypothetical protein